MSYMYGQAGRSTAQHVRSLDQRSVSTTHPALMAARWEMTQWGQLKFPRITTAWCLWRPVSMRALLTVVTSVWSFW